MNLMPGKRVFFYGNGTGNIREILVKNHGGGPFRIRTIEKIPPEKRNCKKGVLVTLWNEEDCSVVMSGEKIVRIHSHWLTLTP